MSETGIPLSEQLEMDNLRALHDGTDEAIRTRLGLRLETVNGCLISIAEHAPSIILNRAIGLGLSQPATEEDIVAIQEAYRRAGVERFFLHVHPEARPEYLPALLSATGLQSHRRWMKFRRDNSPPPEPQSELTARPIGREEALEFGRIATLAFDLDEAAAGLFPGLADQAGFHLYMSFDGKRPAGTGLLYIRGRQACLDWGATDPAFRGRGSQRALLARRIRDAIDAGCTELITATGEAVPGDPQHSYHNIEWAGFRPDYLRENWVPASD